MNGRCPLCGAATKGSYCHAHSWMAGTPLTSKPEPVEPPRRSYAEGWNAHAEYVSRPVKSRLPSVKGSNGNHHHSTKEAA